jgi:hypothetical protein
VTNATMLYKGDGKKTIESGGTGFFPNGNFKSIWAWYDDLDEKILEFTYFYEILHHNNKFNGNIF